MKLSLSTLDKVKKSISNKHNAYIQNDLGKHKL